jgi:hypothetical protein
MICLPLSLAVVEREFTEAGPPLTVAEMDCAIRCGLGQPLPGHPGFRCVGAEVKRRLPDGRRVMTVFYLGLVGG